MSIIDRYLTKEILKYFCIIIAAIIGIYIVVDFFDETEIFFESGLAFPTAFFCFISKMPIAQFIPLSVLLSILVTFGLMSKNNEIVAIKSGGISIYHLLRPILLIGSVFFCVVIFLSEAVVPITKSKAEKILTQANRKKFAMALKEKDIWIKGHNLITHIEYYDSSKKTIHGIKLYFFDDKFRVVRRIDCEKGVFNQGNWILYDIIEQKLDKNNSEISFHKQLIEHLVFSPDDIGVVAVTSESMSAFELYDYIKKIESEGYDATTYRTDFYAKLSFPFICIIMCFVGTGIAFRLGAKESLPVNIVYGIGAAFSYWVFFGFCISLGEGGILNPFFAALIPNLVFLGFGIFTVLNTE
ncbi:LPS export ABC transporter permease LptG [Desulfobacterium sp. N47]